MNPTPTPTHARIIPTMTPTLAQIDVAQRLARAYSHAWACPEGDEVVERWRAAGAVPATWREEMHAAVEPTCGPIAGITAPSYQPLFTTRGGTLLEEQGVLVHETTTGRIRWEIADNRTTVTISRAVTSYFADRVALAGTNPDHLAEVVEEMRAFRSSSGAIDLLTVIHTPGDPERLDVYECPGHATMRADHWQALAIAVSALVGGAVDAARVLRGMVDIVGESAADLHARMAEACEALQALRDQTAEAEEQIAS